MFYPEKKKNNNWQLLKNSVIFENKTTPFGYAEI